MKVKEESEKVGLKLSLQKTKIVASSTITSWLYFWGPKITGDGVCSHAIKKCLLFGRKAMTRQHIKKQRYYFTNESLSNQSHGFSSCHVWM